MLKIDSTFEELENMSKTKLRKILKEKIRNEAFMYLKNHQIKQEKIKDIKYTQLKMQDYLAESDRSILVTKTIYKARGKTLDIKMQKKWKYDNIKCEGCQLNIESGEEILECDKLGKNDKQAEYTWFYSELVTKQIMVGRIMVQKLKRRKQIREEVT